MTARGSAKASPAAPALYMRPARLVLRPYRLDDAERARARFDQDPDVWRFDPGHAPSLDERRADIERYAALRRQFGFGPCAAFLAKPGGPRARWSARAA